MKKIIYIVTASVLILTSAISAFAEERFQDNWKEKIMSEKIKSKEDFINQYADNPKYMSYRISRPNTIVYLPGGFPENIVENMNKCHLHKCIKCAHVIVGESAGSMAPFKQFFVYKDQDYKRYRAFKGLDIENNMTIIPHFTLDNKDIAKACNRFARKNPHVDIYCVEDGGYIIMENHKIIKAHKAYKWIRRPFRRKSRITSISIY